jgi:hypothetical protein
VLGLVVQVSNNALPRGVYLPSIGQIRQVGLICLFKNVRVNCDSSEWFSSGKSTRVGLQ